MIKAIVFDLDGMIYLTEKMFSDRYANDYGVGWDVLGPFFKNTLSECQSGKKDLKEELSKVLVDWKYSGTVEDLMKYWFEDGQTNDEMMQFIAELQSQGIKCGLITNNEKYRFEYLNKIVGLKKNLDFIITSFETGFKKPDPEIFKITLEETGLKPEEIMICDDRDSNLELIKNLGFVPYIYNNITDFKEFLNKHLTY